MHIHGASTLLCSHTKKGTHPHEVVAKAKGLPRTCQAKFSLGLRQIVRARIYPHATVQPHERWATRTRQTLVKGVHLYGIGLLSLRNSCFRDRASIMPLRRVHKREPQRSRVAQLYICGRSSSRDPAEREANQAETGRVTFRIMLSQER